MQYKLTLPRLVSAGSIAVFMLAFISSAKASPIRIAIYAPAPDHIRPVIEHSIRQPDLDVLRIHLNVEESQPVYAPAILPHIRPDTERTISQLPASAPIPVLDIHPDVEYTNKHNPSHDLHHLLDYNSDSEPLHVHLEGSLSSYAMRGLNHEPSSDSRIDRYQNQNSNDEGSSATSLISSHNPFRAFHCASRTLVIQLNAQSTTTSTAADYSFYNSNTDSLKTDRPSKIKGVGLENRELSQ
ncbi:hypothetical protein J3R30DRAFT_3399375 [Lentinula aciculospora]|uniref:Uncharacterized protein n=1 Tax=Lentinula aciculospora TaxID=153920 RepID=A0A9W9AVZ6_9AGAR|nr:hypothetical protein J3R30DRAFT_3399375 [Lentinula aciculospora]